MLQRLALALCLLISWPLAPEARFITVIAGDDGGRIGDYVGKYEAVRDSGKAVMIDGSCKSACTIVLGIVPANRICVTPRARLGFHQAWREGRAQYGASVSVPDAEATAYLLGLYHAPVRRWISAHGGLPPPGGRLLWLRGESLRRMYRPCP
jgi:hypothetical protein